MFIWLIKNWLSVLVAIVSFSAGVFVGYHIGEWQGKKLGRAELKQEITQEVLEVKVKHAEIRNHRPDNAALIKRLRAHTY